MEAAETNGCQGMPWSEELDNKELHGELGGEYDLESRESTFFLYTVSRGQHSPSERPQMWHYAGC